MLTKKRGGINSNFIPTGGDFFDHDKPLTERFYGALIGAGSFNCCLLMEIHTHGCSSNRVVLHLTPAILPYDIIIFVFINKPLFIFFRKWPRYVKERCATYGKK